MLEIACAEVVQFDPLEAMALAARYSGGNVPLLENLIQQWSEQDESAATAFARAQVAGAARDSMIARVALTRAKSHPAEAAQLAIEEIPPGEIQQEAIISVLHQWALQDLDSALTSALQLPPGALRDRALSEIEAAGQRLRPKSTDARSPHELRLGPHVHRWAKQQ